MIRKILYVDDDVESRIMVADYLRYLGHEVITVEEAGDALRIARENPLAVMVLDVNLVGLDGPELMAQLRREHPNVPIVLYSGMSPETDKVKKMLADGANRFLSKNEPLEELVKALHSVAN
jgi:two-component system, response regulator FlrC